MANGVSLNWCGFDRAIANAAKKMSNKKLLMATIGETLVSGTVKRFAAEEDPKGRKWKQSQRAQIQGGQTLSDNAHLRNSIDYAATSDKVMVGSNLVYARIHQLGGSIRPKNGNYLKFRTANGGFISVRKVEMPARPYLGVSAADLEEVKAVFTDFMKGCFS